MRSSVLDADTTGLSTHTSALPHAWRAERHIDDDPAHAHPGREWALALIPAAVTLAIFLPILGNGFVNWDDQANLLISAGCSPPRTSGTMIRLGSALFQGRK